MRKRRKTEEQRDRWWMIERGGGEENQGGLGQELIDALLLYCLRTLPALVCELSALHTVEIFASCPE